MYELARKKKDIVIKNKYQVIKMRVKEKEEEKNTFLFTHWKESLNTT